MIELVMSNKGDHDVKYLMSIHYSKPKGFVGRQIIYKAYNDNEFVGVIAGGSPTLHLAGRNEFFGDKFVLGEIINNNFFHLLPSEDKNLGTKVLKLFRTKITRDWHEKYNSKIIGFETLVELPRKGSLYKADNWLLVGQTKGYTCKRTAGKGTDSWGGKRVWNTRELKPKLVFCKMVS
jgi:hypothetical protein